MSILFWAIVITFVVAAVAFTCWLLLGKSSSVRGVGTGDRLNLIINAFMFVLTVTSIAIALAAFQDSKHSGDAQKQALDKSRDSLQEVVDALSVQTTVLKKQASVLNDAQDTLRQQLEVSRRQQQAMIATNSVLQSTKRTLKSQLDIATEQHSRELALLKKKPQIHFAVHVKSSDVFVEEEEFASGATIQMNDLSSLGLVAANLGDAALIDPTVVIEASPVEVKVFGLNAEYADYSGQHNSFKFSGPSMIPNLEPMIRINSQYGLGFRLVMPDTISETWLSFRVYGSNMAIKEAVIHLTIVRPPKGK